MKKDNLQVPVLIPTSNFAPFGKQSIVKSPFRFSKLHIVVLRIISIFLLLIIAEIIRLLLYLPHNKNYFIYEVYVRLAIDLSSWFFFKSLNLSSIEYRNFLSKNVEIHKQSLTPIISISNHGSPFDGFILVIKFRTRAIGKAVSRLYFGIGAMMISLRCLFVNRSSNNSRSDSLKEIESEILKIQKGPRKDTLHFFVEGGRTPQIFRYPYLLEWYTGAFRHSLPIVAYTIKYEIDERYKHLINPISVEDFFLSLFIPKKFIFEYKKVYNPPEYLKKNNCKENVKKWAEEVRKDYGRINNFILSDKSVYDKFIIKKSFCVNSNESIFKKYVTWKEVKNKFPKIELGDYLKIIEKLKNSYLNNNRGLKFYEYSIGKEFDKINNGYYEQKEVIRIQNDASEEVIYTIEDIDSKYNKADVWVVISFILFKGQEIGKWE